MRFRRLNRSFRAVGRKREITLVTTLRLACCSMSYFSVDDDTLITFRFLGRSLKWTNA